MEENKLGVAMLLSGIATVIFWVFYTSFSTYTQRMNFLFQAYGWTMVIVAVCVLLIVLLVLKNDKDSKVFIVFGTILVIGLSVAAYLFFGKVDNHVYIREVQEATVYLGGLI
jgi:hypothetical protein